MCIYQNVKSVEQKMEVAQTEFTIDDIDMALMYITSYGVELGWSPHVSYFFSVFMEIYTLFPFSHQQLIGKLCTIRIWLLKLFYVF